MGPEIFDEAVKSLMAVCIAIGAVAALLAAGLVGLVYWLAQHLQWAA